MLWLLNTMKTSTKSCMTIQLPKSITLFRYCSDITLTLQRLLHHTANWLLSSYIYDPLKNLAAISLEMSHEGQRKAKVIMNIENSNQKSFDLKNLAKY